MGRFPLLRGCRALQGIQGRDAEPAGTCPAPGAWRQHEFRNTTERERIENRLIISEIGSETLPDRSRFRFRLRGKYHHPHTTPQVGRHLRQAAVLLPSYGTGVWSFHPIDDQHHTRPLRRHIRTLREVCAICKRLRRAVLLLRYSKPNIRCSLPLFLKIMITLRCTEVIQPSVQGISDLHVPGSRRQRKRACLRAAAHQHHPGKCAKPFHVSGMGVHFPERAGDGNQSHWLLRDLVSFFTSMLRSVLPEMAGGVSVTMCMSRISMVLLPLRRNSPGQ